MEAIDDSYDVTATSSLFRASDESMGIEAIATNSIVRMKFDPTGYFGDKYSVPHCMRGYVETTARCKVYLRYSDARVSSSPFVESKGPSLAFLNLQIKLISKS